MKAESFQHHVGGGGWPGGQSQRAEPSHGAAPGTPGIVYRTRPPRLRFRRPGAACRQALGRRAACGFLRSGVLASLLSTRIRAGAASDPAGAVTRKFDPKGVSSRLQTQQTERATFISIDTRSEPRLGGRRTQRRRAGVRLEGRIGSVRVIDDPCGGRGVVVPVPQPHRETQKGGGKA